jgi:hypothetical protein
MRKNARKATSRESSTVSIPSINAAPQGGGDTRLSLVYKGRTMRQLLERIQELGHHGSTTEAVATALRKYEAMLLEREKGNQVVVRDRDGNIPLRLF